MKPGLTGRTHRASRGFTLIELLVVIIILAILAAVVIPRVIGRTDDAKIAKAASDIAAFNTAMELYKLDTGAYPNGDQGMTALDSNIESSPKWNGPYLKTGLPKDPWGQPYIYTYPGEHSVDYDVSSVGPDGKAGTEDDITSWGTK